MEQWHDKKNRKEAGRAKNQTNSVKNKANASPTTSSSHQKVETILVSYLIALWMSEGYTKCKHHT